MRLPWSLRKRKLQAVTSEKSDKERDVPIKALPFEFENDELSIFFDNGLVLFLIWDFGYLNFRVISPTHDITHRFYKSVGGHTCVGSAELLVKLVNAVASIPQVYSVNEIPDSCFDFESSPNKI